MAKTVLAIRKLELPWFTLDPFVFCFYHHDMYPRGNAELGPAASLAGRRLGNDFTLKDGWRMYHGDSVPGFPVHPHRGFETVTFVLQGAVDHSDSHGAAGRYSSRDVQWMTAGSGLQHAEMFPLLNEDRENPLELFQLWLNLPQSRKFVQPAYKMLWSESIPIFTCVDDGAKKTMVDVVAGRLGEKVAPAPAPDSWAVSEENEVAIWHLRMEEGASIQLPPARVSVNRVVYFFAGEALSVAGEELAVLHGAEVDSSVGLSLRCLGHSARCLILQGRPIGEPVVQYGPFVMNTQDEIRQAIEDYQRTSFGGWPWPRPDHVHGKTRCRFARYANGEEVVPG